MSISPIPLGDEGRAVAKHTSSATPEFERRLREQTEQNAELDKEVRYLLQELDIRKEYIAELEHELGSMHAFAAEYAAYRSRLSHRIVDRIALGIHRIPWLARPLQQMRHFASVARGRRSQVGPGTHDDKAR